MTHEHGLCPDDGEFSRKPDAVSPLTRGQRIKQILHRIFEPQSAHEVPDLSGLSDEELRNLAIHASYSETNWDPEAYEANRELVHRADRRSREEQAQDILQLLDVA